MNFCIRLTLRNYCASYEELYTVLIVLESSFFIKITNDLANNSRITS